MSTENTTDIRQSRVGKRPIPLPKGVTVTVSGDKYEVKGPKGTLSRAAVPSVDVKVDPATGVSITPKVSGRDGARLQGLARALLSAMVKGAAEGYVRTLQLVGTGYRAELKGQTLNLSLGFSHPVQFAIPAGLKIEIPGDSKGTTIIMTGSDKELLGHACAKIRGFRPPEPYGGKGVRFMGERVREKAGKAGKGGK